MKYRVKVEKRRLLSVNKMPLQKEFTLKDSRLEEFSHWQWSEFIEAVKQVSSDLDIPEEAVCVEYDVYEPQFFYSASSKRAKPPNFTFHVDYTCRARDQGKLQLYATLEVDFDDHTPAFYMRDALGNGSYPPDCLIRWAAWAVYQFNLKHNPTNLENLFGETSIRVYGLPHCSHPTLTEMQLFMWGLRKAASPVTVHRFRHLREDDWYRSYSYAIWARTEYHGHWVFFYEAGGLDSGEANRDMEIMEQLILDLKKRANVQNHDIESVILERFLLKWSESFEKVAELKEHVPGTELKELFNLSIDESEKVFGSEFSQHLGKIQVAFEAEEYPDALRDLRAVVQDALEYVAEKRGVDITDVREPDVTNLAGKLIKADVLDGRLNQWFQAFASIANLASHGIFPTRDELVNPQIRMRVLSTFVIGRQLILELKYCIKPHTPPARSEHI